MYVYIASLTAFVQDPADDTDEDVGQLRLSLLTEHAIYLPICLPINVYMYVYTASLTVLAQDPADDADENVGQLRF